MLEQVSHWIALIPASDSAGAATAAIVVDFALRLIPSKKPLSIAHVVAGALQLVGAGLKKLGDLLDRVLPQNVKQA